jgi:hypothetical protein
MQTSAFRVSDEKALAQRGRSEPAVLRNMFCSQINGAFVRRRRSNLGSIKGSTRHAYTGEPAHVLRFWQLGYTHVTLFKSKPQSHKHTAFAACSGQMQRITRLKQCRCPSGRGV